MGKHTIDQTFDQASFRIVDIWDIWRKLVVFLPTFYINYTNTNIEHFSKLSSALDEILSHILSRSYESVDIIQVMNSMKF
jgi:hypothetical protein